MAIASIDPIDVFEDHHPKDDGSVHAVAITAASRKVLPPPQCWCDGAIKFFPWSGFAPVEVDETKGMLFDNGFRRRYFSNSERLDDVPPSIVRRYATDFLVGNLPYSHGDEALLVLLQVAAVQCCHVENVPRNNCSKIVWVRHEDAEKFQQYDQCAVLGDLNGLWVANNRSGGLILQRVEGSAGTLCPRRAVTIARGTRLKCRKPKARTTSSTDNEGSETSQPSSSESSFRPRE